LQSSFNASMTLSMRKLASTVPGIYLITNSANGKVYVGQARKISTRWSIHKHHLRCGTHNNRYLQRAWDKLGESAFVFSVAVDLSDVHDGSLTDELNFHEALIFSIHEKTYNILEPGFQGPICGPETRAKLSAVSKAKWDRLKANPELIANMHAWRYTPEGQEIMSAAADTRWSTPGYREAVTQGSRDKWDRPGYRENQIEKAVANWANPEIRENIVAGLVAGWSNPEVKAKRIAATMAGQKKALEDPNSKMSKRFEKRWSNPDEHERQSARMEKHWADPENKERMKSALKAAWARRKARSAAESA
jgi:hypothetical protein